jgi:hypothetical protein
MEILQTMFFIKIGVVLLGLIIFTYGAKTTKTGVGVLGFLILVASIIWLLIGPS